MRYDAKKEIRNILAVLLSAVLFGGLIAGFMIYRYGPTGRYIAGNVLLSPGILDKINYPDIHAATGRKARFVFNAAELSVYDKKTGKMLRQTADAEAYQRFYQSVASIESLEKVSGEIKEGFSRSQPATLVITMRPDYVAKGEEPKIFQVIQFLENDYFRIQVPGAGGLEEWAYFFQSESYDRFVALLREQKPNNE